MATLAQQLAVHERDIIRRALDRNAWNREQTAKELAVSVSTLWRRMQRLGITEADMAKPVERISKESINI